MILDLLISPAYAETAQQQGNIFLSLLPLVLLFGVFYFLLIRPQQKKAKEHKRMVSELQKGDEVVTQGGVLGRIVKVEESFLRLEIAPSIEVALQRHSISLLMPKGTYSSAAESSEKTSVRKRAPSKSTQETNKDSTS